MVDYKRLSDDDLSLAIYRMQAAIEVQLLVIAQTGAAISGFQACAEHRMLIEAHLRAKERFVSELKELETELLRRA
jgi:uncharacterized protein YjiS (DUF1127 family)